LIEEMSRLAATFLLLLLAPLLAACALAIALCEGMPIFYGDPRVGRGGALFTLWKFRTMRHASGPRITAANDARITQLGSLLRRYKLDELPQLWNVIRGDMNLIGPRPETPEFVDLTSPLWQELLSVPPGITGAASVACFDEAALLASAPNPIEFYRTRLLPEKLAIDSAWLRSRSLGSDAGLMVRTLVRIVRSRNRQR
jgi:lipopolysaccharide/colanic/teichoic acid biosynthesis glycosyltransferase